MEFGTKIYAYHKSYEERCDAALFCKLDDPVEASRFSAQAIDPSADAAGDDQQLMATFCNMGSQPNSN